MASSSCSVRPVSKRPAGAGDQASPPDAKRGIAATVAEHYNQLKETGRFDRNKSRIFHMRSFNNWIKSTLIAEAIKQANGVHAERQRQRQQDGDSDRSSSSRDRGLTVLDIGCGKGGDLRKYLIGRIGHLICTDIAETSLQQLRQRYDDIRDRNRFSMECFAADSTRDRLRLKYQNPRQLVDLVSVQFVLHYSFESLAQAEIMLRNISENLAPGGFWIGTTTDASELVHRARAANSPHFGNEVFSVTFQDDTILDPEKKVPLFGYKYDFHLDDCVNCPEFLLHFPTLEHMALKYGLRRVMKRNFADYFDDNVDNGWSLMMRMKGLELINRRNGSQRMTQTVGEYEHAEEWMREHDKETVLTLSKSEWEAITLYCIFAFQKFRRIGDPQDNSSDDDDEKEGEEDERDQTPEKQSRNKRRRDRSPEQEEEPDRKRRR